jgi:hypothetical protein
MLFHDQPDVPDLITGSTSQRERKMNELCEMELKNASDDNENEKKLSQDEVRDLLHKVAILDSTRTYVELRPYFDKDFWVLTITDYAGEWVLSARMDYVGKIKQFNELIKDLLRSVCSFKKV